MRVSLRTTLPVFMLPRYVVPLDVFPITPNGKVDRKALPLPKVPKKADASSGIAQPAPVMSTTNANRDASVILAPIDPGAPGKRSPLVPLQPRGQRTPLFLIHAIDGQVLHYVPLARSLGAGQPVFGIRARGLDGLTTPMDSIPTMAAHYVAEIKRIQLHGPYLLGGGSIGGMVAFETAQQLRRGSEPVDLLVLFGAASPIKDDHSTHQHTARPGAPKLLQKLDALRVRKARAAKRALPNGPVPPRGGARA